MLNLILINLRLINIDNGDLSSWWISIHLFNLYKMNVEIFAVS